MWAYFKRNQQSWYSEEALSALENGPLDCELNVNDSSDPNFPENAEGAFTAECAGFFNPG